MDKAVKIEKQSQDSKVKITSRMIPKDKKQLTRILNGYISAHKVSRTADLKPKMKT